TARRSIGRSLMEVRSGSRGVDKAQVLNDEKSDGSQMGETEMISGCRSLSARWLGFWGCGGGTGVCSDWIETTAGNTNDIGQRWWQVDWGLAVEFLKMAIAASSEGDNFAIAAFSCDCDSRGQLWSGSNLVAIWQQQGDCNGGSGLALIWRQQGSGKAATLIDGVGCGGDERLIWLLQSCDRDLAAIWWQSGVDLAVQRQSILQWRRCQIPLVTAIQQGNRDLAAI
ncbi:hypothetical protein DFJ73DRAFT_816097, partial [Zopfochytrium polystomum]